MYVAWADGQGSQAMWHDMAGRQAGSRQDAKYTYIWAVCGAYDIGAVCVFGSLIRTVGFFDVT